MADGEGFIYVNRAAKNKKRRTNKAATPISFSDSLRRTHDMLVSSGWWESYRGERSILLRSAVVAVIEFDLWRISGAAALTEARRSVLGAQDAGEDDGDMAGTLQCLCLGLGRPTASNESRAQLCVLLDLCAELAIAATDTVLFDPAFEDNDISALHGLGLKVSNVNKKGAYAIDTPTLVFMPHCGIELYERFLRANWTGEQMRRIILVANDLFEYAER
ncbi:SRR1-like protein [Ceratobasidium theobromae]|uniref:SRR1-like protein n=1 Tax=Ceratobasidium theobromae TaxID=1582974 RepID=A0A5N5QXI7_9AGAM|nr:SRR1-like protein [Ceratobasidium theobromae]